MQLTKTLRELEVSSTHEEPPDMCGHECCVQVSAMTP